MNDEEITIIGKIETALKGYNLGDIKYLLEKRKSIAGFILCSCLIDHISCFRYCEDSSWKNYRRFVDEYLGEYGYDSKQLYEDLRCKLVHNYSIGNSTFDLTSGHPVHMKKSPTGSMILNLDDFVFHLEQVLDKYFSQLGTDSELRSLAIKRFKDVGVMGLYN